jgi:hypothetical protein
MRNALTTPFLIPVIGMLTITGAVAQEVTQLRRAVILTVMTEAAITGTAIIKDRLGAEGIGSIEWSATYSNSNWSLRATGMSGKGRNMSYSYSGFIWDQENRNMEAHFAGNGQIMSESGGSVEDFMSFNGQSILVYDQTKDDYINMDFRQNIDFRHIISSYWNWIVGAEVIVGGLKRGPGIPTMLTISSALKDTFSLDNPTPPPPLPVRPDVPDVGVNTVLAGEGKIYTMVSRQSGSIYGNAFNSVILDGSYDDQFRDAKGNINER